MPVLYGIIGYPLTHSFSPAYFNRKFAEQHIDAVYEAFPLEHISKFPALINDRPNLEGLSVTIPYKEAIIPYLDELDVTAEAIGAVNCISIRNGKKKGFNTDATGFKQSLVPLLQPQHTQALVLGTGGASKAVAYVLKQLGIRFQMVSRKAFPLPLQRRGDNAAPLAYEELTNEIITQHKLIVNTTPLGMYPHTDAAPQLPYNSITPRHLLFDLIYNPEETKFLSLGKMQGAAIKNGFEMLHLQAEAAWAIWSTNAQPL